MKTEEKVTPHQASQTEVDITGEKPSQLLLLEVDPKAEIQDSAEKYAPLIFNSGIYTRWKGKHYDMMQLQVKMTGQVQHILSCRPEILALLGVRNYLMRDTDVADLSNTDLEEQITESGRPILSRIDVTSSVSTQARSLLLCDTSPKQHKKYDISYYLDLAQMEVPSLAMKVSKLEQMLHTSLNEKSKFEKGSSEIKKKLEEKIVTLQTEKEILENQLAVLENQNSKSTLDRQSAERVTVEQLNDILILKDEIRALEDRIKDKDKTIDYFKYKLSKLHVSDEKQDAELQQKIAEIRGEDYPSKEPEKGVSSDQTESGIGASAKTLEPIPIKENLSDLFTKRLFDLAQEITDAKLEDLKLLCKEKLTPRELDSLRNPSNLFNMLREKNLISASNTALLEDMLCKIGLNALVGKYLKPSTYQGVSYDQIESGVEASGSTLEPIPTKESPSDLFSKRLSDLAQDITDAKLEELKLLCKDILTHRELDSLRHPYDLFNMLRDKNLISESNTALLEEMLYRIGLNPLVRKYLKSSLYQGLLQKKIEILRTYLKDKYKRHYSNLLPIPWNDKIRLNLHEVYTSLEVQKVKRGALTIDESLENLHDMFKSSDTRRIRIEGAPATGKSTLCRKFAYDWACGELQQYTLLFFLEMRHIAKNNMIDEIFNQLIPDDFDLSKQELSELVSQNINSVLFLCDGLDEPDEYQVESSEIPELISEKLYPWCTVVITTRPRLCDKYLSMCDLYLLVKGFTSKRTNEYILKYFKDDTETGNSLIQQIKDQKETQKLMTDLLRNPLHVSFLCILWEYHKEKGYHFPETLTELYSEILECILKRYCVKNNIELENDEIPKKVLYDRDSLASDSCKAYRNQQVYFDRSDISSEATLNFGLLVRDIGHSRIKAKQMYFFYHITWLEYFTALHVMSQLKSKDATLLEEFLEHPHRHSQILKFIAGIVQRQEGDLFFVELNKKLQNIISSL
ncbi:putative leucine-rich repeat-containing protein DDB_G0290503 [Ptychodera flava]|uniref:putative leucine-rich repeat-containing protein DDB_G0290503 n=1 Tax=Ptychodera flava TaxID=63121 RepID=UPI00396A0320